MERNQIAEIRDFNRYYTHLIGLLDRYILGSDYTLAEARTLFEIYHREGILASEIISVMDMDKGYLSRMLFQFAKKKLIHKKRSQRDARAIHIYLTAKGKTEFEALNKASDMQINKMLKSLTEDHCEKLLSHMSGIKTILSTRQP
jgi:DNA-binding MarR family transcriptional regulator